MADAPKLREAAHIALTIERENVSAPGRSREPCDKASIATAWILP